MAKLIWLIIRDMKESHAAPMFATSGSLLMNQQCHRRHSDQIPYVPLRLVVDASRHFDHPFHFITGTDQRRLFFPSI
jgi:hypothetical protein